MSACASYVWCVGALDTIDRPSGFIRLISVFVSDEEDAAMLLLKSPVIIAVLTMGNTGPRVLKSSKGAAALGPRYTTHTRTDFDARVISQIRYSGLFSKCPEIWADLMIRRSFQVFLMYKATPPLLFPYSHACTS